MIARVLVLARSRRQYRLDLPRLKRAFPGAEIKFAESAGHALLFGLQRTAHETLCFFPHWDSNPRYRANPEVMQLLYEAYNQAEVKRGETAEDRALTAELTPRRTKAKGKVRREG